MIFLLFVSLEEERKEKIENKTAGKLAVSILVGGHHLAWNPFRSYTSQYIEREKENKSSVNKANEPAGIPK